MIATCVRCGTPAAAVMSFDYASAQVWIDEVWIEKGGAGDGTARPQPGYLLCAPHADRLSPPLGWRLADRRTATRLFAPLEVA